MKKSTKRIINLALIVALLAVVFLLEQVVNPNHILFAVLKKGAIYALVAVSMNLLNGFTGLFSLGQAGFMLIGAYVYAILTIPTSAKAAVYKYFDCAVSFSLPEVFGSFLGEGAGMVVGVLVAIILAGLVAAIFAFLIGLPVLRLKSDYLAIATLGFAEILRAFFQWDALGPITNGSNLLKSYPTFTDFNIMGANGEVAIHLSTLMPFLLAGACIAIIVMLINSSYGRAFKAIREDEVAAEAMGINLAKTKMLSFCISCFFAGISGALLAMFQNTISATQFKSAMTYEILLIVVIGGIGSVSGSVISSFLFVAASEWWLRGLDTGTFLGISAPGIFRNGFRQVVFAVIIMAIVLFWSRGIMGDRELGVDRTVNWFKRIFGRKPKLAASDGSNTTGGDDHE
ncbi:MAG: branched-chain amino acid ABC transporter permease [Oscillospiraceae bacterium]